MLLPHYPQVSAALLALEEAARAAREGDHHAAAGASYEAQRSAEAAFANPAVLAQLSYPPSHLIGVYLPLFAPLGMALAQALFSEVGAVMKERRNRT